MTEESRIVYESHTAVHNRNAQFVQNSTVNKYQIFILWNVLDERTVLVSISSIPSTKGERDKNMFYINEQQENKRVRGINHTG